MTTSAQIRPTGILTALTLIAALAGGCNNAGQGAVSGAGIGALSGLAIGSLTGSAGKGAAIGAIVGGVGGAVIGDQNRRKAEESAAPPPPTKQPPVVVTSGAPQVVVVQPTYRTGTALGRLVGSWQVNGTVDVGNGDTLPIHGTATATIDKIYFVRIELRFVDPRTGQTIQGTSVISQTGNRGLELTNSFSSFPEVKHFIGEMDPSGNVFDFTQTSPTSASRRLIFRMSSGASWTAEAWDGGRRTESFTFTPA